jgi:CubicO group peptidase (beta-lactamase class C family)
MPRRLILACLLLLAPVAARAAERPPAAELDAALEAARKAWDAPGLAAVVVRDDAVVYLKGVGVRKAGAADAVTPDTLFAVGSCTKAFTATALALLVDEGKAGWDDPVRKHVPWFRLADPLADRDVTLRDLLCHRTGLARHDLLWYHAPWTVEETVRRMAYLEPAHPFRAAYEYNNLAYLAAGLAASAAAGTPWHQYVQHRLFDPLGMKGAVFTHAARLAAPDHAYPHRRGAGGKAEVGPWFDDSKQLRASGSIKAGVRDLAPWLRLQLAGGVFEGKRLVSAAALEETHRPQVVVPGGDGLHSYGLGWHVEEYRGRPVLQHGGAVDGFRAQIVLVPKAKLGVAVLANLDETDLVTAAANALVDRLLGLPPEDWNAHFAASRKPAEKKAKHPPRVPGTKPSRGLDAYAGAYEERAYGRVEVTKDGDGLRLAWSSFRVPLRHLHYDTFTAGEEPTGRLTDEPAAFTLGTDGEVATLRFLGRTFKKTK